MAVSIFSNRVWTVTAVVSLCVLAGPLLAVPSRKPPSSPSPRELLLKVLMAEERIPFSARQTVVVSSGDKAEATVTDEVSYGYSRNTVTYVLPESARGRIVVRDGKRRWTIDPNARAVIESEITHRPVSAQRASKVASQVAASYRLALGPGSPMIAGRSTYVLTLAPNSNDRPRRIWWVDRKTGLVLRREVYRSDGGLDQTTAYTNLTFGTSRARVSLKPGLPAGYRYVKRPSDGSVSTVAAARALDPAASQIPAQLAGGFEFESARLVDAQGAKAIQVQYTDGVAGFSLFKILAKAKLPPGENARTVSVGGAAGTLVNSVAPYRVLSWQFEGATFNLVSDIGDATMVNLARLIHF